MAPSGIEPATVRIATYYKTQLCYSLTHVKTYFRIFYFLERIALE
jgi:hypothetical protein